MAPFTASTSSCHSPPELALSKLASHLSFASGSQHDVGATRIGRRKAPAEFPFRSSTSAAPLDDNSVWGLVLQQSFVPPVGIATYEVAWEAATSISPSPSSYCQAGEFSSLYSPEMITKECYLSTTPLSQHRLLTTPPDPVPNPLCPEDHACIPVSWKGENRGKGVAVGDGSVRLLERSGMRNRNPGGPVDKLQDGATLPAITHGNREEVGQCEKAEFPGREFRDDSDDGWGADNGTDEVFWKRSTTRKPAPAAAWDWDRMSSQSFSGYEPSYNEEPHRRIRGDRFTNASPPENMSVTPENLSNTTSVAGRRQEKAVRRLKSVIGHFTGANTLGDSGQQQKMEQAWDISNEDRR